MKKRASICIASLLLTTYAASAVVIPYDITPVSIDGIWQQSEWQNAERLVITVSPVDSVVVHMKHDMNAMYFVFTGKLESANALFPEILFDPQEAKGSAWSSDQWWMHVSATDCESSGKYGDYGNCKVIQPGWEGAPNFTMGAPYTDTVEIKIPFSKIGFNPTTQNTMGMALVLTNTATIWKLWPASADQNIPSTWSQAIISKFPVHINNNAIASKLQLIPNPTSGMILLYGLQPGSLVTIYDITGKITGTHKAISGPMQIDCSKLNTGTYFAEIRTNEGMVVKKIMKQ